jgi:multidrug efflux pump
MTMFGMILAVGMLVDGAIVVVEYADKRIAQGVGPMTAYTEAARRMFWPIISSTATTLCAFLPMLFWPGMPGQFMGQLPVTLIFVLTSSLIVALIYLPILGGVAGRLSRLCTRMRARVLNRPDTPPRPPGMYRRRLFGRVIGSIVLNPVGPFVALGVAGALIAGTFVYFGVHNNGVEFFVQTEPERAIVYVRARGNLSLDQRDSMVRATEQAAGRFSLNWRPGMRAARARISWTRSIGGSPRSPVFWPKSSARRMVPSRASRSSWRSSRTVGPTSTAPPGSPATGSPGPPA